METLQQLYRDTYTGEDVKTVGLYINGSWRYQTEFVENLDIQVLHSDRAVVIGNGISRLDFNLKLILPNRDHTPWGEVGPWQPAVNKKKFKTYGCNAVYRNYRPDFLIATGDKFLDEIVATDYCEDNIVYANKYALPLYENKFHYIPQDPSYNSGAIAAYLAAFDGHKKVYLLGFDGIDNDSDIYNVYANTNAYPSKTELIREDYWVQALDHVMEIYSDTEFIRVAPSNTFRTPELWKYRLNFRTINFRQFVLEADI